MKPLRVVGVGLAFAGTVVVAGFGAGCSVSGERMASDVGGPAVEPARMVPVRAFPVADRGLLVDPFPLPADREIADLSEEGVFVRGSATATVIDTRVFDPQIAPAVVDPVDARRVKVHLPPHQRPAFQAEDPERSLQNFQMGGTSGEPVVDADSVSEFSGIDRTGWVPPDPTLAVGPNHVVVTVNQSLAFYTKSGTLQFEQILGSQGSPGFFEPIGAGNFAFDPKCFYDHEAGRFVVLALEVYSSTAYVTIAVSDDADPNGVWYKYRTDAVTEISGNDYWWDYPGFGYDGEAYYVTSNLFPLNSGGFGGVGFRVFDKSDMLVGDPVNFFTTRDGGGASVQAAQHYGDNVSDGGAAYFVQTNGGSSLEVYSIEDPIGNPQLRSLSVAVPNHGSAGEVPTQGGGSIFALNIRIMNAAWRDGNLYAAHAVSVGGVAKPRWYEIDLRGWPNGSFPTLAQSGTVDPGAGIEGFFPTVAVNEAGAVALAYGTSSSNQRIRFWVTARKAGDPAGEMGDPVLVRQSSASLGSDSGQRWGDYYDATIDPVDGQTFWAIGQTQESGIGWDTRIAKFSLVASPCAADIAAPFGVLDLADINAFVTGFTGNDPIADVAEPFGVWDLSDIGVFVGAFSAGCP